MSKLTLPGLRSVVSFTWERFLAKIAIGFEPKPARKPVSGTLVNRDLSPMPASLWCPTLWRGPKPTSAISRPPKSLERDLATTVSRYLDADAGRFVPCGPPGSPDISGYPVNRNMGDQCRIAGDQFCFRYFPKSISGRHQRAMAPTRVISPSRFQPFPPRCRMPRPYDSATTAMMRKKGPVR